MLYSTNLETNDIHHDPDIQGSDLVRLNIMRPLLKHQVFQHVYVFMLITIFGLHVCVESMLNLIKGTHHARMSKLITMNRVFDVAASLLFFFRWLVLPALQQDTWVEALLTLVNVFPLFAVGGCYLAFFFIISHNFEGAHFFDKSSDKVTQSFLWKQVASSSNVGGSFLCFINGGLNYQVSCNMVSLSGMYHIYLVL